MQGFVKCLWGTELYLNFVKCKTNFKMRKKKIRNWNKKKINCINKMRILNNKMQF